jgi:hypothetical protein
MQIEVSGPQDWLEQFRMVLGDQLERHGYKAGPRLGRIQSGAVATFVKDDVIISVQVSEESESGDALLRMESEGEIPHADEIWDDAVIALGSEWIARLSSMARDSKKVEQALKNPKG